MPEIPPPELLKRFSDVFGAPPDLLVRAPGRVDLIGTHTDYNEGLVLPAAITRYAWVAARPRPNRLVTLHSPDMDDQVTFDLDHLDAKTDTTGRLLPNWAQYAAGVAWSLSGEAIDLPGGEMAITSDVPVGAGMSSSAAVEVAYAYAWTQLAGWQGDLMKLARLCQRAENAYVGVSSGLMDQFSSAFGRADHALLFDCRSLAWEAVPLSDHVALVVADTATRRSLTTSRYNERRAECELALASLKAALPGITALRDVSAEQFHEHKDSIPQPARDRAQHVIEEIARVAEAAEALRGGDVVRLGELMDASQVSSRDLFAASGPELDAMWEASQGHLARLGGRFLGGGWAGCMIYLVDAEGSEDFAAYTGQRYAERTGKNPEFYVVQAAQGVQSVPISRPGV